METKEKITIEDILYQAKKRNPLINSKLIIKAYEYAKEKHKNQFRKSGEPYIIHPMHVAYILANLNLDTETICSALLHDVVEDTETTYEDINNIFGTQIAQMVEGVTKLNNLFKTVEERQAENYKKMFIAMEKDIRIIILKLADRLHNISTLKYLKRDRQIAIAKETIELYAPIAHKLGMYDLKVKLEDGAFKFLYPKEYNNITNKLDEQKNKQKQLLEITKDEIKVQLKRQKIVSSVSIETKHIYNIYKKMIQKRINIEEIKDLFAIKIKTKKKQDCYRILGIINTVYNIIPGTFKDYIATPRNNMYQAIHEVILGEKGVVLEIQICSYIMDKIAKYGITNYFPYIQKGKIEKKQEVEFKNKLYGIYDSLELENIIKDPKEFLSTLKSELLDDEVYLFTPKGDIKVLPRGATPIDFAYLIHEQIGKHITGCKINSIEMPVITQLKNGDIAQILTSKENIQAKEEWLKYVKTAKAKSQILKLLKKEKQNSKQNLKIEVLALDRKDLVLEITDVFTKNNINIQSLKTNLNEDKVKINIVAEIIENSDSKIIINQILKLRNILDAKSEE